LVAVGEQVARVLEACPVTDGPDPEVPLGC
jgi:hypothetical protein